jgi:hypothetical protein
MRVALLSVIYGNSIALDAASSAVEPQPSGRGYVIKHHRGDMG